MSLFPSAFDALAAPAASSKPMSLGAGAPAAAGSKRKRRASLSGGKDEQLRATQVNLAKLMDKVERGDFKDTDRAGREAMGQMGKNKKAKKAHGEKGGPKGEQPKGGMGKGEQQKGGQQKGGKSGKAEQQQKGKGKEKDGKGGKFGDKPAPKAAPSPKHDAGKKNKSKPAEQSTPNAKPQAKGTPALKVAPVEFDDAFDLPTPKKKAAAADDGLTDMQRKMQTKLEGARFRWINEQLYSTPSDAAVAMMDRDPKVFADYHDTHRQLTAAWPAPPLEHITTILAPLPKGTVIVDLGCGDAGLARALVPSGKVVLSYDLVGDIHHGPRSSGSEGWVVPCDFLTGVPLPGRPGGEPDEEGEGTKKRRKSHGGKRDPAASEIVDVVVCCLSLMGTNWVGGVYEAARVLKQGGAFHVAEVTSRFVSTSAFVDTITSFGLVLESQEEPSTHFTLFKFIKKTPTPAGPVRGQEGWDARVEKGEEILRACVYKRR